MTVLHAYAQESTLRLDAPGGPDLTLATALGLTPDGVEEHPTFFSGFAAHPDVLAAGLLAVADVAAASYVELSAASRSLDPVVTASGDRLRMESFSRCNGVYARLDLLSDGIDAGDIGFGTTNVDLNAPLRAQLAGVGGAELLHVSVGADRLEVATLDATHVERKVDLPSRWVRGFAEVPGVTAGMAHAFDVDRMAAMRFVGSLTRSAPGPSIHLAPSAHGIRSVASPDRCVVHVAGTARLSAARRVMRHTRTLRAFRHDSDASAWVFEMDGARLTLALTGDPYRGFSGEGAQLDALAAAHAGDDARLAEHLAWQPVVDPAALATDSGLPLARVRSGLAVLGASGRVGFDLTDGAWFHRELPFDEERVVRDNPRLDKARRLVESGAVVRDGDGWRVGDASPRWVRDVGGARVCTCPWQARHGGSRGPCAHTLAVAITCGQRG